MAPEWSRLYRLPLAPASASVWQPAHISLKRARAYVQRSCRTGWTLTTLLATVLVAEPESVAPLLPQPAASATAANAISRLASSGAVLRHGSRPSFHFDIRPPRF